MALAMFCSGVGAAEGERQFLRSVGSLSLSDAQVHALVTVSKSTNAFPTVSVTWRAGGVATDANSKSMTQAGWFVFAEQPARIWVFDGDGLSLLERSDKALSDSSSPEAFKRCPRQVREALPERIRKRYFK
ncbi:MAG: hypothetical protein AB1705_23960 [Verrucomicrobiota bacterium]